MLACMGYDDWVSQKHPMYLARKVKVEALDKTYKESIKSEKDVNCEEFMRVWRDWSKEGLTTYLHAFAARRVVGSMMSPSYNYLSSIKRTSKFFFLYKYTKSRVAMEQKWQHGAVLLPRSAKHRRNGIKMPNRSNRKAKDPAILSEKNKFGRERPMPLAAYAWHPLLGVLLASCQ